MARHIGQPRTSLWRKPISGLSALPAFHAFLTRSEVQRSNTNEFSYTSHNVFFQWLQWWSRYFSLIVLASLVSTAGQFFVEYTELATRAGPNSNSACFSLTQYFLFSSVGYIYGSSTSLLPDVNFLFIKSSWSNYTAGNFRRSGLNWFDFKGA